MFKWLTNLFNTEPKFVATPLRVEPTIVWPEELPEYDDKDEEWLMADGLDDAFVGLAHPWQAGRKPVAIYDYDKVINVFMERDGMSHEDAVEFFEFNVIGA